MIHLKDVGPILVAGATGKQGGATARALLSEGAEVRALVRNSRAEAAAALEAIGIQLIVGDLDDPASLAPACADAYGVFSVQNPDFENLDADTESVRGMNLINMSKAAGIKHFVQTTATGSGDYYRRSGWAERRGEVNSIVIKGYLEDQVRDAGFAHWTVLRPAFFMENIPYIMRDDRLVTAYAPDAPVPMIAVSDIGAAAAAAFRDPSKFSGTTIELAGEFLTMPEVAAILSIAWRRKLDAPTLTPSQVIAEGFMVPMVEAQEWHNEVGLPARPDVARSFDLQITPLKQWAKAHPR